MIKIIKNGDVPKKEISWIYTATCRNCGCVFDCDNGDFNYKDRGFFDGASFCVGIINCPCCNEEIMISKDTPHKDKI